jgi:hypothetical protein
MAPGELTLALAQRAEAIEAQLQSARELLQDDTVALSGSPRVSCNDIGLHGLLLPLLVLILVTDVAVQCVQYSPLAWKTLHEAVFEDHLAAAVLGACGKR